MGDGGLIAFAGIALGFLTARGPSSATSVARARGGSAPQNADGSIRPSGVRSTGSSASHARSGPGEATLAKRLRCRRLNRGRGPGCDRAAKAAVPPCCAARCQRHNVQRCTPTKPARTPRGCLTFKSRTAKRRRASSTAPLPSGLIAHHNTRRTMLPFQRAAHVALSMRGSINLLIRQGMAAWMRAWHEPLSGAGAATTPAPENRSILPPACPQAEATRLLVNMALSHVRLTPCNA